MSGGDPYTVGSKLNELCLKIRSRKGLDHKDIPKLEQYYDKL